MSKELTAFNPSKLPAFAKTIEISDLARSLSGGGGGSFGKRISVKGGVFRLMSGSDEVAAIEDRHLDVVIQQYGYWAYGLLFAIIFAETGLVVAPFLPGDSLLFIAGAYFAT